MQALGTDPPSSASAHDCPPKESRGPAIPPHYPAPCCLARFRTRSDAALHTFTCNTAQPSSPPYSRAPPTQTQQQSTYPPAHSRTSLHTHTWRKPFAFRASDPKSSDPKSSGPKSLDPCVCSGCSTFCASGGEGKPRDRRLLCRRGGLSPYLEGGAEGVQCRGGSAS